MNPQLFTDIDFSFFKSFFSSNDDEEDKKKQKEKKSHKKNAKSVSQNSNISKNDSYKSSETTYTEEENISKKTDEEKRIDKKRDKKEDKKRDKKEDKKEEKKEDKKEDKKIEKKENKKEDKIKEKNKEKKKEKKKEEKKGEFKDISLKKKKDSNEKPTKDEYLSFLVSYIKNIYLLRKEVKKLIKKAKDNYVIISSVNKNSDLHMNIIVNEEEIKKVKSTYEPILNENMFYIPRKAFKKKNLLKFSFANNKNESIIDPKFNTEYDSGEFINVINLKKIKDKEEEREEEFQTFLESYYTLKPAFSKQSIETKKLSLGIVRVKKKHKTMDQKEGFSFGVHKIPSSSILKQRPIKRVTSNKKITFSEINETIAYKKDE